MFEPPSWIGRAVRPPSLSRDKAILVAERISALTHFMSSVEHLANGRERRRGGVNYWPVARAATGLKPGMYAHVADLAARPRVTIAVHVAKVGAAALLMTPYGGRRTRGVADALLAGLTLAVAPRHHYGGDGSDQVAFTVQSLSALARAGQRRPAVADGALWASALQAALAYGVSGWVKLAGPRWREDRALPGIMRTRTYGSPWMHRLIVQHPEIARLLGRTTLVLECAFPLIFLGRGWLTKPFLLGTSSMHVGIAATMNLGRFVPAFHSFYPALVYVTQPKGQAEDRDDTTPRMLGAMTAGLFATLAVLARRRRDRVLTPRPGADRLRTAGGSDLVYVRREAGSDSDSEWVVVLENGLSSLPDMWAWVEQELASRGVTTVTYDRAGYGPSTSSATSDRSLSDLMADLAELVAEVKARYPGSRLAVMGHSLGGYLTYRLAQQRPDLVDVAFLLDPTHPQQTIRSPQQQEIADLALSNLAMTQASMALGLGVFLRSAEWYPGLPESAGVRVTDHCRDRRMWRAASQEWSMAITEFTSDDASAHAITAVDRPVVVISAGRTVGLDEKVHAMHAELASTGSPGQHLVVADAGHDGVLTEEQHARSVGRSVHDVLLDHSHMGDKVVVA